MNQQEIARSYKHVGKHFQWLNGELKADTSVLYESGIKDQENFKGKKMNMFCNLVVLVQLIQRPQNTTNAEYFKKFFIA